MTRISLAPGQTLDSLHYETTDTGLLCHVMCLFHSTTLCAYSQRDGQAELAYFAGLSDML